MTSPIIEKIQTLPQHILPGHALSRLMQRLTHCSKPWFKNRFITQFVKYYDVDLSQASREKAEEYQNFNDFFTRELKPDARPLDKGEDIILSPADGVISQFGEIQDGHLIQAKGHDYTLNDLLGQDSILAANFHNGQFATIYLSPRDYHRLHMPITGKLTEMIYIPGRLFSVNNATTRNIPNVFARNERVVAVFETELGPMALVLVGALFVASIETVWQGVITPPHGRGIQSWTYNEQDIVLKQGEELGRFNMGSTIIMLFPKNRINWHTSLTNGTSVQMGKTVAKKTNQE